MILHRSAREVAKTMSLHAIHLTLQLHAREAAAALSMQAKAAYLSSAAKWDKKVGKEFDKFQAKLRKIAYPNMKPKKVSSADLMQLFAALGIPQGKS